jgi:hypothetical protein
MPESPEPTWIFDDAPASGARRGGLAMAHVIPTDLDNFVREVLQNARDQRDEHETVKVRFTFMELTGGFKEGFLRALDWHELKPHIETAAVEGGITIGPQLRRALEVMADNSLLLLRIEDSGTRGLVGGEDDRSEGTNFNQLCRDELVTGESSETRGGSFGLGKSVLWRFSLPSTVRFHRGSRNAGAPACACSAAPSCPFWRWLKCEFSDVTASLDARGVDCCVQPLLQTSFRTTLS